MCFMKLIPKGSLHREPRIATRPIRVLKVGYLRDDNCFESKVYPKIYKPNKVYKEAPLKPYKALIHKGYLEIYRGFHSYRELAHTYVTYFFCHYAIGIFEIPQGAIYYSDGDCFVSDSIKLIKVITSKKEWENENFKPELIL